MSGCSVDWTPSMEEAFEAWVLRCSEKFRELHQELSQLTMLELSSIPLQFVNSWAGLEPQRCPQCGSWNADCDGKRIKCLNCGHEARGVSWPTGVAPSVNSGQCPARPESLASVGQQAVKKIKLTSGRGRTILCFHLDGIDSGLSLRKQAKALGRVVSYETIRKHRKEMNHEQ